MPWFIVDDKLHSHRKTARVPVEAMGLWVLAGSWCADNLEDGFIPDYVARRLDSKATRHASSLVAAGFWIVATRDGEKGWQFHDWSTFQPSRADVLKKREEAKERMRLFRARSRERTQNEHGTNSEVRAQLRQPQPSPTQPSPTNKDSGSVSGRGLTSVRADSRPPRTCPKHEGMDDPPACGKCADARKAADAWQPPTFTPETRCGLHPKHRALGCPKCATETGPPPQGWRERQETTS